MMNRRDFLVRALASIPATALAPLAAFGEAKFPERPIRLVVPFSAGGVNDIVGRQWADRMRPVLGSVYVENQGGAGGTIAVVDVMRSQPDGHTVLLGSTSTMVLNTMTMSRLPYDPNKDFEPIYFLCASATSIVVHASVPAKTVQELIAHAKANPGKLSFGSAGTGTMSHLSGELFKQTTGLTDIVHIPYKGSGPGFADLVSGHIPMMSPNITGQLLELHRSGKIRILAVNAPARLSAAPDIPTAIEQGVPNMIGQLALGIFAPAKTSPAIVERIAEATRTALADADYQKALVSSGFESFPNSGPEHAKRYLAEEHARWKPLVDAIGLKVQ
jgi:tripartite-type tricarboxylate transporter receptor subunit TctC